MKKIIYSLYWLISLTWGGIMTCIGLIVAATMRASGHTPKHLGPNVYFVIGRNWGGVNFGPVFLISETSEKVSKFHEAGHGLQNLILGPFFPFVVAIPSVVRYWYKAIETKKGKQFPKGWYDSVWFEGQATEWGNKIYNKNN